MSYSWQDPVPIDIPLPEGFRPHSYHVGPRAVAAVVFIRTSPEDGAITSIVIAYREDTRANEQDAARRRLRGQVANNIATAVRDQLLKRKNMADPILTGWRTGGQTALLAYIKHENKYPVIAFNPSPIPRPYIRSLRRLFRLPDSSTRERELGAATSSCAGFSD
jgi:hypothetical protein